MKKKPFNSKETAPKAPPKGHCDAIPSELEKWVIEIIGWVSDKWTMAVLNALDERGGSALYPVG
jgi:hypothetical protein